MKKKKNDSKIPLPCLAERTMSGLPEEIYLDILLRVPVKSTFVCKCVCKSWFSIISNPDFVKKHLEVTKQRNNCSLMVQSCNKFLSYDSLSSSNESDDAVPVALVCPYKYSRYSGRAIQLLGSCDGLVYGWNSILYFFFLWNPTTKEYKELPNKLDAYYIFDGGYHSFGYDNKTDDYKLVKIDRKREHTVVLVYSLKSSSWKSSTFTSLQYEFPYAQVSGVFFNGAPHWKGVIGKASSEVILTIDISEERFEEMQLPMALPSTQNYTSIGVLEGCLCVLASLKETFEVWVMQNYGIPDSWAKLYIITYNSMMYYPGSYVELIGSFKNGEILFTDKYDVTSYNSKYGTVRKTEIDYIEDGGALRYFESLVSLNSNTVERRKKPKDISITLMKIKMTKRNRERARLGYLIRS